MGFSAKVQAGFLTFHGWVYRTTQGRLGHHMIGVPSLLLETTGRRTGARRSSALVYASDGNKYVLVASNGGSDHPPAWLLNLRSQPTVEISVGPTRKKAQATIVERGDPEYERLWRLVNQTNHGRYDRYQTQTKRPLPLVLLSPG